MKKLLFVATLLFTIFTFAQVPQGISYQAIALNASGNAVVSSNVGIRLSILDNSASGTILYTETHVKMTNTKGLFNLTIGMGTPTSGTFASINWKVNAKFLKVEMDVAGGTNYVLVGTTQLLSVPYALVAGSVASPTQSISFKNNSGTGKAVVYSTSEARGHNGTSWGSAVTFTGTVIGANASNTTAVVYSNSEARGYNGTSWSSAATLNGTVFGSVASNNDIAVYSNSEARAYNGTSWSSAATLSGTIIGGVSSNTKLAVYSTTEARAYNGTSWSSAATLNGTIIGAVASGDIIVVYSNTEAVAYNGTSWGSPVAFNGTVIGSIGGGN
ncbi:MAG: hypothetical protein V4648_07790 [Bacteroidota bacterium]